jgi:hypothetical protein
MTVILTADFLKEDAFEEASLLTTLNTGLGHRWDRSVSDERAQRRAMRLQVLAKSEGGG